MTTTDTTLFDFIDGDVGWDGPFQMVEARRALSPTNFPRIDYSLNPYGGCEHGCIYCYATGYTHSDPSQWRVVKVRRNIVDRLSKELPAVSGRVGLGTSTDPYQYAERRFRLTRSCLEVLSSKRVPFSIFTKSDLVTRDIDIISQCDSMVSLTITTLDERVSRMTEPGAPLPSRRLATARELCDAGIDTVALIAPVLSSLRGHEEDLVRAIADTGIRYISCDHLNTRNVDTTRLDRMGIGRSQEVMDALLDAGRSVGVRVTDIY